VTRAVLGFLVLLTGCTHLSFLSTYTDYSLHGIPNYQEVDASIIRGGQPKDEAACRYLRDVKHVERWIKYSYEREGSSEVCESIGIQVLHFEMPPSDLHDFVQRPSLSIVKAALIELLKCNIDGVVCFEGCLYGRDRTGLMTALYLWITGAMDKATAWTYAATDHGFRGFFHELSDTYEDFKP
jgi:hypothetical protein